MGDSRSWGADMEDEVKTCPHGVESGYFSICQCEGCRQDRDNWSEVRVMARQLQTAAHDKLGSLPSGPLREQFRDRMLSLMEVDDG